MKEITSWPGWESVRLIGRGAFGKVYKIQKTEYGNTYTAALKVITVEYNEYTIPFGMEEKQLQSYYKSVVEDISKECALMYDFKGYTNFVSYEDHMILENIAEKRWDILIRMELLQPVKTWLKIMGDSPQNIINIGIDICTALEICHEKKILHRDIKPENIFVNSTGDFKLGDFGIARSLDNSDTVYSKKGTYSYMAPEVFQGGKYGFESDIYSLGVVLYRLLNRKPPFISAMEYSVKDSETALSKQMSGIPIPFPERGSKELCQVVLKAISFLPADRYKSALEFKEALLNTPEWLEKESNDIGGKESAEKAEEEEFPTIVSNPTSNRLRRKDFIRVAIVFTTISIFFAFITLIMRRTKVPVADTVQSDTGYNKEVDSSDGIVDIVMDSDILISGTKEGMDFVKDGRIIENNKEVDVASTDTNVAYVEYDEIIQKNVVYALSPGSTTISVIYSGKRYDKEITVINDVNNKNNILLDPIYDSVLLHETFSKKTSKLRFLLKGCIPDDINILYYYDPTLFLETKSSWIDNEYIIDITNRGSKSTGRMIVLVTDKERPNIIFSFCSVEIKID